MCEKAWGEATQDSCLGEVVGLAQFQLIRHIFTCKHPEHQQRYRRQHQSRVPSVAEVHRHPLPTFSELRLPKQRPKHRRRTPATLASHPPPPIQSQANIAGTPDYFSNDPPQPPSTSRGCHARSTPQSRAPGSQRRPNRCSRSRTPPRPPIRRRAAAVPESSVQPVPRAEAVMMAMASAGMRVTVAEMPTQERARAGQKYCGPNRRPARRGCEPHNGSNRRRRRRSDNLGHPQTQVLLLGVGVEKAMANQTRKRKAKQRRKINRSPQWILVLAAAYVLAAPPRSNPPIVSIERDPPPAARVCYNRSPAPGAPFQWTTTQRNSSQRRLRSTCRPPLVTAGRNGGATGVPVNRPGQADQLGSDPRRRQLHQRTCERFHLGSQAKD